MSRSTRVTVTAMAMVAMVAVVMAMVMAMVAVWAVMNGWPQRLLPQVISQMLKVRVVMYNV